jgi:hypothetical protein
LLKIKCTAKLRKTALNLFGCEKTICLVRSKFLQTTSQKIPLCQGRLYRENEKAELTAKDEDFT